MRACRHETMHRKGNFIRLLLAGCATLMTTCGRTLARLSRRFAPATKAEELRAEEQPELAEERDHLALLLRCTKAGFIEWDAVNDVTRYSERFKEMLGHPPDADTSQWPNIFNLMHPDDREPMRARFREAIGRKENPGIQDAGEPMEYRLCRAGGSYIWGPTEGGAEADETGRTKRFITSFVDISKFREKEQRLRDQVMLTDALIDDNPNAMYLK